MATQVIMPQLGESVVEGTVGQWLVAEGQSVKEYDPLLTVMTDKVDTEIPAPASGILLKIFVPEGQTVAKGAVLAVIGQPTETLPEITGATHAATAIDSGVAATNRQTSQPPAATPLAQRMAADHDLDLSQVVGTGPGGRITKEDVEAHVAATEDAPDTPPPAAQGFGRGFISPAVARLSGELGVDLDQVIGTGAGGRITKKDVLAYVAAPVPREGAHVTHAPLTSPSAADLPAWERSGTGSLFKPTGEVEAAAPVMETVPPDDAAVAPLSAIRRAIAKHMALSKQTSPHVTTVMEADMTQVIRARERLRGEFERQGVRLTFTPFFIQAIVAGLRAVPEANSSFREDALLVHRRIHIGMAVARDDGLIVPVIRDADEKSLVGLARAVNDLAARARARRLTPDEVQGGTFTLTNHSTGGSLFATPIINQPQAGILGVGTIQKRPVVISRSDSLLPDSDDALAIRPMVYLSFSFDHRILDGAGADGFLSAVKRFLESYSG